MMKELYDHYEEKMKKVVTVLNEALATVRVGRASAALLDKIVVDYYGSPTPIPQVGTVSVPEPKTLVIQPWDSSILRDVEKAILKSELGITPNNDGKSIRLNFPPLTEERRRDLVKVVHKYAEEAKVSIRNVRRDAVEHFKSEKKKSEITEDDLKDIEKDIQTMTDKYTKDIDSVCASKEKEILEV